MSVKSHSAGRRAAQALLIAGLLLLAPACSDDPVVSQDLCIDFTPDAQPAPGLVTAQLGLDSECRVAEIEIVVTGVDDVFAFASTITYDTDAVTYAGYSLTDSVLQSDGTDVQVIINEEEFGTLTVGATRLLSDTGVNVGDTAPAIKLAFTIWAIQVTSGDFTLDPQCMLGSEIEAEPRQDVACSGGTILVR